MNYDVKIKPVLVLIPPLLGLGIGAAAVMCPEMHFPGYAGSITELRHRIVDANEKIARLDNDNNALLIATGKLDRIEKFNLPPSDAQMIFRQKIEKAANTADIKVRVLGNIVETRATKTILFYETSFTAEGGIGEISEFLDILYREPPRIYWKSFNLRPNNIRNPEFLILNGVARGVLFEDDKGEASNKRTDKTQPEQKI